MARWASAAWQADAERWLDDRLAEQGRGRTGPVDQVRIRPWGTVLSAPTTGGDVWLKAPVPATAFEVGLYALLTRETPDDVLHPLAADSERGLLLLPDGGAVLREAHPEDHAHADVLAEALQRYGALQRALAPNVDELLAAAVADMRPHVMPQRFAEALEVTAPLATGSDERRATHRQVAALAPEVERWTAIVMASSIPASLDHNDLHGGNVFVDGDSMRFFDWGDAVVAHPFAGLLVPLRVLAGLRGVPVDHPVIDAMRDEYLRTFARDDEDLHATADAAVRLAKIARALTWDRALKASREAGEAIDPDWAMAPLEALAAVLAPHPLGV